MTTTGSEDPSQKEAPRHSERLHYQTKQFLYGVRKSRHPLYACNAFQSLPSEQCIPAARESGVSLNCLKPGHYKSSCTSTQRCQKCQRCTTPCCISPLPLDLPGHLLLTLVWRLLCLLPTFKHLHKRSILGPGHLLQEVRHLTCRRSTLMCVTEA